MEHFWDRGAMFVRELRELYPEPKPHINTLSTLTRILESEGFVAHKAYGPSYQYYPVVSREEYSKGTLSGVITSCFGNSYKNAVSALVEEEKLSVEDLKEIIASIEAGSK